MKQKEIFPGEPGLAFIKTPIGYLRLSADEKGITRLQICEDFSQTLDGSRNLTRGYSKEADRAISLARDWLEAYFKGDFKDLAKRPMPALNPAGTDFQKKVWRAAMELDLGRTSTYGQLASFIGRPNAYRAVGNALARNPILIMIPCHRMLRADGSLGGFAAGTSIKKKLLNLERNIERQK